MYKMLYMALVMGAICGSYLSGSSQGSKKKLQNAIDKGLWKDSKGQIPFLGNLFTTQGVKSLISEGEAANPLIDRKTSMTALHYAAKLGRKEIVDKLLSENTNPQGAADPNVQDENDNTPLHYAIQSYKNPPTDPQEKHQKIKETIQTLLTHPETDILIENINGKSPFEMLSNTNLIEDEDIKRHVMGESRDEFIQAVLQAIGRARGLDEGEAERFFIVNFLMEDLYESLVFLSQRLGVSNVA